MDFFCVSELKATRALTGDSVPIISWVTGGSPTLLRFWGPESMGGFGDLTAKIEAEAERTGRSTLEVGNEQLYKPKDGGVVQVPGVPPMYDYEFHPQKLPFEMPLAVIMNAGREFLKDSNAMLVASSDAYEKDSLDAVKAWQSKDQKTIYVIGPLLPAASVASEQSDVNKDNSNVAVFLDSILEKYGKQSVISFGTNFWPTTPEYIEEIIDALIEKRFPFILSHASPFARVSPELLTKIQDSGLGLSTSWSPQQFILSHPATGWFLTHGGHGGITESLGSGVPLICWPFDADQPAAAAHITEDLKAAFELHEVKTNLRLKPIHRTGTVVQGTREAVGDEIRRVLDACRGKEGAQVRRNAERIKDEFHAAWKEDGAARIALRAFIQNSMLAILGPIVILSILALYVRLNNKRLLRLPDEVVAFSPKRWTPAYVREAAAKLTKAPSITINEQLPPKTGRRYIVVGGGGFLGGWIVASLLERGEDPHHIRILDIRPPLREDVIVAQEKGVQYIQVDVSNSAAVEAAFTAAWPDSIPSPLPELTVFHTAANIRFYERYEMFLPSSAKVNIRGTENIVNSARSAGASILIYTSSGSVAVRRSRFLLWPWEKEPKFFVQVINDDETALPKRHAEHFSNYAATKMQADRIVRAADRSRSGTASILRTGCIRPGNGIFGPRGDMLCGAYLVRQTNPTWIANIMQSFCYVENCALAHLCYEQRLAELQNGGTNPDIGGEAFVVADPGPIPTYGDVYSTLETLTDGECTFPNLPPTMMLVIAIIIEWYYIAHHLWKTNLGTTAGNLLPPLGGDIVNLQPSLFALTSVHLIFDDSRARLPPEKGGLGYKGAWTTFEGLHKTVEEHKSGVGRSGRRSDLAGVSFGFGFGKAQKAVAEVNGKLVDGLGVDPVKMLSTET
ncbi:hypothetical protein C0991_010721 [Blastosporella zonata]|nr:hypothetical protein C0991_010721 [Blastosporella zonata]